MVDEEEFGAIKNMMDGIIDDRSVPKNIRGSVEEAKNALEGEGEAGVKISTAVSMLDEVINDSNMPMYTRTQIWNIVSRLEEMRSEMED